MKDNIKKNISFFGSGFALYGYMKSFNSKNYYFNTLFKYKKYIENRKDLKGLINKITFVKTENALLEKSHIIVYAKRPLDQEKFIYKLVSNKKFHNKFFFLEKPLARSPEKSIKLLKLLKKNKIKINIGYLFLFFHKIEDIQKFTSKTCTINWDFTSFKAKLNSIKSWKLNENQGGGPINFYGIQILALVCRYFKVREIIASQIFHNNKKITQWYAKAFLSNKRLLFININLNSKRNILSIECDNKKIFQSRNLFSHHKRKNDLRIIFLKKMITDKFLKNNYKFYLEVLLVWKKVVDITKFIDTNATSRHKSKF